MQVAMTKMQVAMTKMQVAMTKMQVAMTKMQVPMTKMQVAMTKMQVAMTKMQVAMLTHGRLSSLLSTNLGLYFKLLTRLGYFRPIRPMPQSYMPHATGLYAPCYRATGPMVQGYRPVHAL